MKDHEIIDYRLVRTWAIWGLIWLTLFPALGFILSFNFMLPDLQGAEAYTQFGRTRPVHVAGVIWGAFSTLFIGLSYYIVPRLTGVRVAFEKIGWLNLWLWNLAVFAGSASFILGFSTGVEVAEYPLPVAIVFEIVFVLATIQFLVTISRRIEKKIYVSLWYLIAAFIWTSMSWALGHFIIPNFIPGISNAAFHGLYLHYTVGLWVTPAGYVLIYYFLPPAAQNALYSHKLSLIGFWSLAFFYPLVGTHHYIFSPIVDFTETIAIVASMALIIPVWTVTVNFLGTMKGKWYLFQNDHTVRFLIIGAIFYLIGCFQGSVEALRTVQTSTHFTDFVIGHSHLTIAGVFVLWALGGLYYIWPKISMSPVNDSHARWSFWLVTIGIAVHSTLLASVGILQGSLWANLVPFIDTVTTLRPWWWGRTFFGGMIDLGLALSAWNFLQMWRNRPRGDEAHLLPENLPREAV